MMQKYTKNDEIFLTLGVIYWNQGCELDRILFEIEFEFYLF